MKPLLLWLTLCAALAGCTKTNEEAEIAKQGSGGIDSTACDTTAMQFQAKIKPILVANCYSCHGNGLSEGGINLDTYARVKQLAVNGTLVGVISHAPGYYPMPDGLPKLPACSINKITAWVVRGAPEN